MTNCMDENANRMLRYAFDVLIFGAQKKRTSSSRTGGATVKAGFLTGVGQWEHLEFNPLPKPRPWRNKKKKKKKNSKTDPIAISPAPHPPPPSSTPAAIYGRWTKRRKRTNQKPLRLLSRLNATTPGRTGLRGAMKHK